MRLRLLSPGRRSLLPLAAAAAIAAAVLVAGACHKAVLNAPPTATLTVTAEPAGIPATNGASTIRVSVRVAGQLVPDGVIVNSILPGRIATITRQDANNEPIIPRKRPLSSGLRRT